ncbi:unnamed protein product [Arctia plantaginis]|uniref:Uncharacterized protein n=1 Tax=Arctia plantaginis TaxID=874455 RepID=A0A8S1BGB6_ARCPL|nr:unnamed protein product [Arctia plantaginis]
MPKVEPKKIVNLTELTVHVVTCFRRAQISVTFTKKCSKPLSSNEIVDFVHNLDSDDEATGIDIYIDPPGDGLVSDSDSGDETNASFENLSRRQLLAPTELVLHGNKDNDDNESEDNLPLFALASQNTISDVPLSSRPGQPQARKWVKRDLSKMDNEWIAPPPRSVVTYEMRRIQSLSLNYFLVTK